MALPAVRVTRLEVDASRFSDFSLNWSEGEVAPAAVQVVTVRLAATALHTFNALLRLVGNQTAEPTHSVRRWAAS